ncbi:DUF934 domain-containing protein [Hoeflea olei]|uniref:Oxidoreductase n=1 Tax=Hoeflea olei TaxID=1480615 RepID=A0A1C1YXR2_9HYPH|nr:DUF934 domain-containing protein [Hoeflea olei]OCW58176.1 oxidoreductase [Hoeflea olei]
MTVIWTQDGIVENDPWTAADGEGAGLVSLAEALDHALDNTPLGVQLAPDDDVRDLAPILDRIAIVALSFPAFNDGRAFSQAALLRQRVGYGGELRAVGAVLIDQIPLMLRTGFDSFAVSHAPTVARLRDRRLPGIDLHYQPSVDKAAAGPGYSWRRRAAG